MKKNMKNCLGAAFAGLLLVGMAMMMDGCVATVGPGGVYYDYDYYPGLDVYFYPAGNVYYWNEGGHWRSGGALPGRYDLHGQNHVPYHAHSQQPWSERR
jgi:hypothetical protein